MSRVDKTDDVDEELEKFRETFNHFDKNGDGTITIKEFGTVFQALGQNPTNEQIQQMIKDVDTDKNQSLSFEEFLKLVKKNACGKTKKERENDLKEAFQIMDRDKNGHICAEEFRKVLKGCGEKLSEEEVMEMMTIADINQDGNIDYEEFVKKMA